MPDLSGAEEACLELAWESLCRGSYPVGAVLLDDAGLVRAQGRNRVFEERDGEAGLAGGRLAHAEVNALAGLSPRRRYDQYHLVSTLEPGLLCVGAITMSTVGRLTFIGADPYAGATTVTRTAPYLRRPDIQVAGPRADAVGRLATGMCLAYYLRNKPSAALVAAYRKLRPDLAATGEALLRAGLFEIAQQGLSWPLAAAELLRAG